MLGIGSVERGEIIPISQPYRCFDYIRQCAIGEGQYLCYICNHLISFRANAAWDDGAVRSNGHLARNENEISCADCGRERYTSSAKGLLIGHVEAFHVLFDVFCGVSRKDQGKQSVNQVLSCSRMRH